MKLPAFFREHALPLTVAIASALGVVMLGMGQRDLRLAFVALVAIAASFVLTDVKGWVRLNRVIANIAAVVAVAVSVRDFMRFDSGTQLLAIANLLIYLQIVLLFQEKLLRVYWQILVLGLLEVVIGAALNLGALFGVLLVFYMVAMQLAVMLLYLRRESLETTASARRWKKPFAVDDRAGRPIAETIGVLPASGHRASRMPARAVLREISSASAATLLVTAVVFMAVPRVGSTMWQPASMTFQPTIGYSGTISLGALGAVADNPELVMRVEFRHERDDSRPYVVRGEPLFRGNILTHYSRGQWQHIGLLSSAEPDPLPEKPYNAAAVLQCITIEPLDDATLFGVYPFYRLPGQGGSEVQFDTLRRKYIRSEGDVSRQFFFKTLTTGIQESRQQPITPERAITNGERQQLLQLPAQQQAEGALPIDELPELTAAAQRRIELVGLDRNEPYFAYNAARTLELYLQGPTFRYSLLPQERDPAIDPVEDFIKNNPQGHCEYFASALVLMLRSLGVPARVVVGFKGGDFNQVGSFYQVRQLHAHAWVEAYLGPDQIPPDARPTGAASRSAGWLTLDPTPALDEGSLFDRSSFLNVIADLGDYFKYVWSNYVVGLNADRQRDAIYRPLAEFASNAEQLAAGQGGVLAVLWQWLGTSALTLRGVLVLVIGVVVTAMVILRLLRLAITLYRSRSRRLARAAAKRPPVEFYERFEQILARHGLPRRLQQTPLELALAAGAEMVSAAATYPEATIPRRIVEAYYRVRFGRHALDVKETQLIETQLARLAEVLDLKGRGKA